MPVPEIVSDIPLVWWRRVPALTEARIDVRLHTLVVGQAYPAGWMAKPINEDVNPRRQSLPSTDSMACFSLLGFCRIAA